MEELIKAKADIAVAQRPRSTNLSEHLANERTYLAYLRTTLSLMSFEIAINRFSLWLSQSRDLAAEPRFGRELIETSQLGIGMVVLGAVLLAWAVVRYSQVLRNIEAQDFRPRPLSIWILTLLVLVGALSGAGWLIVS